MENCECCECFLRDCLATLPNKAALFAHLTEHWNQSQQTRLCCVCKKSIDDMTAHCKLDEQRCIDTQHAMLYSVVCDKEHWVRFRATMAQRCWAYSFQRHNQCEQGCSESCCRGEEKQ